MKTACKSSLNPEVVKSHASTNFQDFQTSPTSLDFQDFPDFLSVYPGAVSTEESRALIDLSEAVGYAYAPIEGKLDGPCGFQVTAGRNNCRAAIEDENLAGVLWGRLKRLVPKQLENSKAVGLNERLRFYRYEAGQDFSRHRDGYYLRESGERSLLTLMIYLNADFAGGETYFPECERVITPQTGTLLLFSHRLWHEGQRVTSGRKYVLRTDVMYEPFNS